MKSLSTIFTYLCVVAPFALVNAASQLTVDCTSKIRRVTHCANGSLYGLIENVPMDYKTFVAPLHPYVFRNPARGGNGNQHPYGDAIKVARRLTESPGALMSVDLPDMLPGWPYNWPGMQSWLNQVKSFINDKKKSGLTNWYGLEIWNEPDGTWKDSNGSFNQMWKQTYDVIRQADPGEKIIGPCYSWYQENKMKDFLQFCKQNNCIPDIISWHELSGIEGVSSHLKAYRNLERSLGIKELPISINEYCDAEHELEGQPGSSARFIGKFERYKVDTAMITWWFVPHPGRLGSLMATDNQKGAGWYFYKWYGDMTGDMVNVTPPNDNSKLVDGAACVDADQQYVSFIFGGPNDGSIRAVIKNIPSFIGSSANVKVEKIDWKNKDTPSNGPNTISEKKYNVSNGQITVDINGTNGSSGYRIYITRGDGGSNTGNTGNNNNNNNNNGNTQPTTGGKYKIVNRNSGKVLAVVSDSTSNGADVIQWSDNGKTSQQWVITDEGNGYKIMNVNANKALDVSENSVKDGGDVIIWSDNGHNNQRWNIQNVGGGYVTIKNVNSGKNLDVEKESTSDGADVIQWGNNGNSNQQWKLVAIDVTKQTGSQQTGGQKTSSNQPTSNASSCSAAILSQGYKCCSSGCSVVYTDGDGTWGFENDQWCGCNLSSSATATCPASIASQGYKCCSSNNCDVYLTDESGRWGVENNDWCGISNSC